MKHLINWINQSIKWIKQLNTIGKRDREEYVLIPWMKHLINWINQSIKSINQLNEIGESDREAYV